MYNFIGNIAMKAINRGIFTLLLVGLAISIQACQPSSSSAPMQSADASAPLKVLLVSGVNNHDWESTNSFLLDLIGDAGMFEVTPSITPSREADSTEWLSWNPDFSAYDVVLLDYNDFRGRNYNGGFWSARVRQNFETYISGGGAALALHASNNPFHGWEAYEQMIGLLWRRSDTGTSVHYDDEGNLVRMGPGEGGNAGHGVLHDWQIQTRDPDHPIMQGMPGVWLHPHDELYHSQRGPAENMNILASAYSDPEHRGTGNHELMVWWIPYGEGKVLTMLPGHHWGDQEDDQAYRCVGFRTLLNRSLEWLATNRVTIPVPDNFPTATTSSVVPAATASAN